MIDLASVLIAAWIVGAAITIFLFDRIIVHGIKNDQNFAKEPSIVFVTRHPMGFLSFAFISLWVWPLELAVLLVQVFRAVVFRVKMRIMKRQALRILMKLKISATKLNQDGEMSLEETESVIDKIEKLSSLTEGLK